MADAKLKVKKIKRHVPEGRVHIQATYNNTTVTITDSLGQVIAWSSAGAAGFKGARKSTPYAASVAAQTAVEKAKLYGLEKVEVTVSGVGSGREQAIRSLQANGLQVSTITDITPVPHNGCRRPKARRV
jgi:small subunit ribosomal protein S11